MPAKIQIIHAQDFLKATPEGKLDLEESIKNFWKLRLLLFHKMITIL